MRAPAPRGAPREDNRATTSDRSPRHRLGQAARGAAGPAALAVVACVACWATGWRGTDWAAQIYRSAQAAHHGVVVWDPGWYGGTFPLNYSLVYPLAAGWLGLWPVAAASAGLAAACFDLLVSPTLGHRPTARWYFALLTVVEVSIGQLPTLLGEAFALACVLSWVRAGQDGSAGRPRAAWAALSALSGVLAALSTPIAGAFLCLALVGWGLASVLDSCPGPGRASLAKLKRPSGPALLRMAGGAALLAVAAALPLLFPSPGYFPFEFSDAIVVLAIAALLAAPGLGTPVTVRLCAGIYAVATIAVFLVPTQMGDNDARMAAYIGVPLALCYIPSWHQRLIGAARALPRRALPRRALAVATTGAALALVAGLVVWDWAPMAETLGGPADGSSSTAAFYRPLVAELASLSGGRPVRVEVPPLAHHWESAYLPPAILLARGWERQLDMSYDAIFYRPGPLGALAYRDWLLSNGVSYVALAAAPLDYAATAEAKLLRSGTLPGLVQVWRTADWRLWRVTGAPGLASGPATVTAMSTGGVTLHFGYPGLSVLKVRWSPYWSVVQGPGPGTCLQDAPGGWTEVGASRAGDVRVAIEALATWDGARAPDKRCPAPQAARRRSIDGVNRA